MGVMNDTPRTDRKWGEPLTYEDRAFIAENKVARLERELRQAAAALERQQAEHDATVAHLGDRMRGYQDLQLKAETALDDSKENLSIACAFGADQYNRAKRGEAAMVEQERLLERLDVLIKKQIEELEEARKENDLLVHKLITCGVAAEHSNSELTNTGAYAGKWDSPQAQQVRKLRKALEEAQRDVARLDFLQNYVGPDTNISVWRTLLGVWLIDRGNGLEFEEFDEERITDGHKTIRAAIDAAIAGNGQP
jgi:hypothetical protein